MGQAKLILQSQDGQISQEVPFTKANITIGRKPGNDLHFNRAEISGNHAAFTTENDQYFVSDLGSTNGTLLNGAQLVARERYTLQHGDVITIMPFRITFLMESTTSETMIEAPKAAPVAQRKGSGTEPDLGARLGTGTEENKREDFGSAQASPPSATATKRAPEKPAPPPVVAEAEAPAEAKEPAPAPPAAPKKEAAAASAPAPAAAAAEQAPPPEIPKRSALPDYVWLGIGAILVIAGIGLVVLMFMLL